MSGKKVRLTLWVAPEVKERIKRDAASLGVSASTYVSVISSGHDMEAVYSYVMRRYGKASWADGIPKGSFLFPKNPEPHGTPCDTPEEEPSHSP